MNEDTPITDSPTPEPALDFTEYTKPYLTPFGREIPPALRIDSEGRCILNRKACEGLPSTGAFDLAITLDGKHVRISFRSSGRYPYSLNSEDALSLPIVRQALTDATGSKPTRLYAPCASSQNGAMVFGPLVPIAKPASKPNPGEEKPPRLPAPGAASSAGSAFRTPEALLAAFPIPDVDLEGLSLLKVINRTFRGESVIVAINAVSHENAGEVRKARTWAESLIPHLKGWRESDLNELKQTVCQAQTEKRAGAAK